MMLKLAGGFILDLKTAVKLFNANPLMRAHMASNNADSIIYAAKSMQVLHRAKTEYAWLYSLIDDWFGRTQTNSSQPAVYTNPLA